MYSNQKELYRNLHEYVFGMLNDNISTLKIINVLIRAEVPLQTFVTGVKLYNMVQNRLDNVEISLKKGFFSIFSSSKSKKLTREDLKILENRYLLLLTCFIISSKYYRDIAFTNESWEDISDIDKKMLNEAEKIALKALDYHVGSQGDSSVLKTITNNLKKIGIDVPEYQNVTPGKKIKVFIQKVLCFN